MEVWGRSAAVNRLTCLAAFLLLWALAIAGRLFSLQVVQHARYAALARSQQEHEIDIPAPRGTILDRNGQPLAISVPTDSVSVNPQQIADLKLATEVLGNTLNLDQRVLYRRLEWARHNHRYNAGHGLGFVHMDKRHDTDNSQHFNGILDQLPLLGNLMGPLASGIENGLSPSQTRAVGKYAPLTIQS